MITLRSNLVPLATANGSTAAVRAELEQERARLAKIKEAGGW